MTHPSLPKSRLEALTDGIFAVTMTLLVLDLKIPAPSSSMLADVAALIDRLDNYAISFVVLAVFWVGHLRMMRRMREPDMAFAAFNLAFLLFTTLVPPLTTLLGDHPAMPRAAVLYGGNLLLILACETLMWRRICNHLSNETITEPDAVWRMVRRRYGFAIAVVLCGIGAALFEIALGSSRGLSAWLYLLLLAAGVMRPPLRGS
ncbi:MAG TPA: TMEM175 family protein [Casimicrobiaceae bacterium]|nr:TMEM175 family protein [Casimicrobiaceae bacterium]